QYAHHDPGHRIRATADLHDLAVEEAYQGVENLGRNSTAAATRPAGPSADAVRPQDVDDRDDATDERHDLSDAPNDEQWDHPPQRHPLQRCALPPQAPGFPQSNVLHPQTLRCATVGGEAVVLGRTSINAHPDTVPDAVDEGPSVVVAAPAEGLHGGRAGAG